MKRLLIALGLGVLMGTSAMALPMSPPPPTDGPHELGIVDGECHVFDAKGGTTRGVLENISVTPNGKITMKCSLAKGLRLSGIPKRGAVKFDYDNRPVLCRTVSSIILLNGETEYTYYETEDWQNIVAVSGASSLICHYRPEDGLTVPISAPAEAE